MNAGEDQPCFCFFTILEQLFYHIQACCVNGEYTAHSDDPDFWCFFNNMHGLSEFAGSSKEKRTVYFKDLYAIRYFSCYNGVWIILFIPVSKLFCYDSNIGELSHSLHKENDREQHSDLYGECQIKEHRKAECGEQDNNVASRAFKKLPENLDLAHVPGNNDKNCCQRRHWNELGPFSKKEHDQEQRNSVNYPCDWSSAAIFDIGCCSGDCSSNGDATKKRSNDICCSLGNQLHI